MMRDIVEKLEFGCPFRHGTIGEKDAERAEVWMQEGADEITRLRAEVLRLTALCDGYRGEVERLKGITSTQDMVCAECSEISGETALAALTRARAEVTEFEKAKAYISGDRLGSYTLYGQWTLTANLTIEEIENSRYRTALERGRAEGMEEAVKVVESVRFWNLASRKEVTDAIREAACRLAEQANTK